MYTYTLTLIELERLRSTGLEGAILFGSDQI